MWQPQKQTNSWYGHRIVSDILKFESLRCFSALTTRNRSQLTPNVLLIHNLKEVTDRHNDIYLEFTRLEPLIQQWKNLTRTEKMIIGTIISKEKERNLSIYLLVLKHQLYEAFMNFYRQWQLAMGK